MKANKYVGQFLETLDNLDKSGKHIPGLIVSSPGFGKTSTIDIWCKYHDYNLTTLIASNFSADDILGLQAVDSGRLKRLTPSWFNSLIETSENGKRNVLFLDEIGACDAYIQSPLFNLIFNHDLAGAKLPDNTLIVAASNYSEDLNNSFKMTAPLVNRFMILNLRPQDFDIMEVLDNDLDLIDKKSMEEFLGLVPEKRYSFAKFKDWVTNNWQEFKFNKSKYVEDQEMGGLLGFISLRSFNYAIQFTEAYMSNYGDSIWMRIVGDTLGVSAKREDKPMRLVLECYEQSFAYDENAFMQKTIAALCDMISAGGKELLEDNLSILERMVSEATQDNITGADIASFVALQSKYTSNDMLDKISSIMTSKFIG